MIIYFKDGQLSFDGTMVILDERNEFKRVIVVDGRNGFKPNEKFINKLDDFDTNLSIITNVPFFMSGEYGWNEATSSFDIFIECKSGKFVNIHELTNRELRKYHNLCKLYISGEFDEGIRSN